MAVRARGVAVRRGRCCGRGAEELDLQLDGGVPGDEVGQGLGPGPVDAVAGAVGDVPLRQRVDGGPRGAGLLGGEGAQPGVDAGFVDLGRRFGGDGPGPYTWWSWRGKAFDNDAGWRIDYLIASPSLAEATKDVVVHRAPSYAERWSDHAPVVATFDL